MTNVLIVCGKIGWDRIDRVLKLDPGAHWTVVTEVEQAAPRGLADTYKVSLKSISNYRLQRAVSERSVRDEALDVATSIGNAEIASGVNLRQHLFYKWFSLWWMIEPALRDLLVNLIESVRLLRTVMETEKPDNVYMVGKGSRRIFVSETCLLDPEVAVTVAQRHGINVVRTKPVSPSTKVFVQLALPSLIRLALWAGSRVGRAVYLTSRWFKPVAQERVPRRTIAAISDHLNWRLAARPGKAAAGKTDAIIAGVLDELDADLSSRVLLADFLGFAGLGLRAITEKVSRFAQIEYRPLELYVGKQVLKDVWMHAHLFRARWDELKDFPALAKAASYDGVELWNAIRPKMALFFRFWLPLGVYYTEAMASFIRHEQPHALLLVGEQGVYGRCFLAAAQAHGVATVGVQHGIIAQDNRQYTHTAGTVAADGRFVGTTLCPIPDATAVYGELFKRILVARGGYPERSVIVTGQPLYDSLHNTRDNGAEERIRRQFNIASDRHIVVLATHTHRGFTLDQSRHLLGTVFEAVCEVPQAKLIVKLHPAEEPSLYRVVAKEKSVLEDVLIVRDVNLFDLLRGCTMLLTAHSTVGLEAMLFGKPVITVNVTGERDVMPYAESGAAVEVRNAAELAHAIRTILGDNETARKLEEGRTRFLADSLRPLDGNAGRRIADLAVSMADARVARGKREGGT